MIRLFIELRVFNGGIIVSLLCVNELVMLVIDWSIVVLISVLMSLVIGVYGDLVLLLSMCGVRWVLMIVLIVRFVKESVVVISLWWSLERVVSVVIVSVIQLMCVIRFFLLGEC